MKFQDFHVKRESRRSFCKHPLRSLKFGAFCNSLRNCLNRIKELNCFRRRPRVTTRRDSRSAIEVEPMGESQGMQRSRRGQNQGLPQANNQVMMFSPAAGQERPTSYDEAALRDHIVRLKSLKTDLALNLPHTIALPDGEEYPGCNFNHIRLHNAEQQAEMMNNYIRPPPNRTISNCTPVPYFTANSVGHFPKHPILTLSVPRYNYARGGKVGSPGASLDSNPCVSSPHDAAGMYAVPGNAVAGNDFAGMAIAGSFHMSGANGNSNGMDGYIRDLTDNQRGAIDDPPPPYSDVVVCKGKCSE